MIPERMRPHGSIALVLLVAGCSPRSLVVLSVDASPALADLRSLHVTATHGVTVVDYDVQEPGGALFSIPPQKTMGFDVAAELSGELAFTARALAGDGSSVADGATTATIHPGGIATATLVLAGCPAGSLARGGQCLPAPVAYWTFDEGSGTVANDASGNASNGALTNGPAWVAGKVGPGALSFDGIDDHVAIGDPVSGKLDVGTGSFSLALWINRVAGAGAYDVPFWKGGSSTAYPGYDLECDSANCAVSLSDGAISRGASFGPSTVNQWTRLVAVVDRGTNQLLAYRDGVLVSRTDITGLQSLSSSNGANVGSGISASFFKGTIDDVLLFDRALDAVQVAALE